MVDTAAAAGIDGMLFTDVIEEEAAELSEELARRDIDLISLIAPTTTDERVDTMLPLGRSLFGDYLFAVELAGTLLLVATIGAIAIAPRRRRGTL